MGLGLSVSLTLFNEGLSAHNLLDSIINQTKPAKEIVISDGGSADRTVETIKNFQKKHKNIKLIIKPSTRSEGRNISIENSKNEIIVVTDGDCIARKDWLAKITAPFKDGDVDMVAGFYTMSAKTPLQKALSVFLGVVPKKFDKNKFLPSTRSVAFRKSLWKKVGGFPETGKNSAEDTDFNYLVVKAGARIVRVKSAQVVWNIPTFFESMRKFYNYAKWDAKKGVWWHPVQKFSTHNIKVALVLVRYSLGITLLFLGLKHPALWYLLVGGIIGYTFWSFKKVSYLTDNKKAGIWGILVQISVDLAVMTGFVRGITQRPS